MTTASHNGRRRPSGGSPSRASGASGARGGYGERRRVEPARASARTAAASSRGGSRAHSFDFEPERAYGARNGSRPTQAQARAGERARRHRDPAPSRPLPIRALCALGRGVRALFFAIGGAFAFVWSKSRVAASAILAVLLIACVVALDTAFTADRVYKGVSVGDVDVSNMTIDEAEQAITDSYVPRLTATSVYIYADEETANSADPELKMIENEALAEQMSFEEAQENKKLWITSAQALEASLPARKLAESAMGVGRETGFAARLGAFFSGTSIPVYADFDETLLTNLISDINATLGYPIVDFGVAFNDDHAAEVTEGNDGYVLDNDKFTARINEALLADESSIVGFVAKVEHAPVRIDRDCAQLTCDTINAVMPESVTFESEGNAYTFTKATLCEWMKTEPSEAQGATVLKPFVDRDLASPSILAELNSDGTGDSVSVRFVKEGDGILVQPEGEVSIPNIEGALSALNASLFGSFYETAQVPEGADVPTIPINTEQYAGSLSVDDALSYGLVTRFSTFTTQYTNTTSTSNRTFNIHLAADKIGNSIVGANGGKWSFNDTAGPCDEANGFREAGVIESGEYTTGIGGGICQVATTVFNAAYTAGLPINERHNHTLYSASYPAGRDAAIAYGSLDLVWTNSTASDILVRTSYTDTSITVALIGTSPGLTVSTDTGEWTEGEKFSTKYEVDESLGANESYVKIAGTNGLKITVVRTVKDASGNVVQKDTFKSVYSPITRVIAFGEGSDMAAVRDKYTEKAPASTSSSTASSGTATGASAQGGSSASGSSSSGASASSGASGAGGGNAGSDTAMDAESE